MDSKRLTILKALTDFLANEITVANGYQHDLTDKVRRGRLALDNTSDPAPVLTIIEEAQLDSQVDAPSNRTGSGIDNVDWRLLVQGWAVTDRVNPTDPAYLLMADVQKALAKLYVEDFDAEPTYRLGGLVHAIRPSSGLVRQPEPTDLSACFYLKLTIRFVENVADPYDLS